jgi:hypothetical protein
VIDFLFSRPAGESSAEESGAEGGAAGAEASAAAGAGGGAEQMDASTQGEDSSPKKKGRKRKVGYLLTCLLVEESPMAQVGPLRKHLGPGCARLIRLCSGCCSVGLLIWLLSAVCTYAESSQSLLSP